MLEEMTCPECEGDSYSECDCCGAEFACDLCDGAGVVEYDEEEDEDLE